MRYSNHTPAHETAFLELTAGGAAAVLIYSDNIAAGGTVHRYDGSGVRTVAVGGVIMVPVEFFVRFFGAAYENGVLSRGGASYSAADPYVKDGVTYLPVVAAADALGLAAKTYYENRFAVVGTADDIARLDGDAALVSAGTYAILGTYDAAQFTAADYRVAKDNWRRKLVGTPEINDRSNPAVDSKIAYIERTCEANRAKMNRGVNPPDDDPVILFGDEPAVESADLTTQYRLLSALARGYAAPGSRFFGDAALLSDILYGLDWLYRHLYGQAEVAGTGWRDMHAFNWWDWYVGAAEHLTDMIFLLEAHLTKEQIRNYLACFEYAATFMRHRPNAAEAMSRICICTKVGLALEEAKYLNREYIDFDMLLDLKEEGTGPRADYVDFTHGMPYNMTYGILNLDRELLVSSILSGTPLSYNSPQMYNQFMMAKYMFEPAMYRGQGFMMFCGRSTFACERSQAVSVIVNLLPMIGVFGEEEDAYLRRLIKRNSSTPELQNMVRGRCSLYDLSVYEAILRDDSIPDENDYEYAHAWFMGDRAAQHRNNYAVGIAVSSEREPSYESINSANKTGWYTGDGALYLYTAYDDSQYDGKNFIDNINIAYRFPGTTEDSRERVIRSINSTKAWHMPTDFAGSVQFEDKYLTCAMDFSSYHFAGPDENIPDTGYGGSLAVHINDLRAKKAWFCFDNEIVALGAGITSTMNSPVHTSLEHRRIVKDDAYSQIVCDGNGRAVLAKAPFALTSPDAKWVCMEGHAGFVLPAGGEIFVSRYNCDTCVGQPYFELRLEHGVNPDNASYAYVIVPYASCETLDAYAANPDIEILSNTAEIQAVKEMTTGVTGYVVHAPGSCGTVTADTPCILMTGERDGILTAVLTDPTHKCERASVVLEGRYAVSECGAKITAVCEENRTTLTYDLALANGRPQQVTLRML